MAINGSNVANLASVFSKKVDERFYKESQAMMALNSDYKFTGVRTVHVYSIPTAQMNDYSRTGTNRYGTPTDLVLSVQDMVIQNDRSWTFTIDKGDKIESEMVLDAGKAVSRQLREVIVPEFDTYAFRTLALAAQTNGTTNTTTATKSNAYELFLAAQESMGNNMVPDTGRVAFCSYKFANLLKQDPAFMKYSNMSQQMVIKGILGEVDGCKVVKVPSSRLPTGAAFIMTHPIAAVGVKQLQEYKIHSDPPGLSGWLAEGRFIYDVFVLNNKKNAIWYQGAAITP